MGLVTFKGLRGKPVMDQSARHIGRIADVEIATDRWQVESIVIALDRPMLETLGVAKPLFGRPKIRVGTHTIKSTGDSVLLNVDVSTLASALSTHGR